jgi:hypothetical protein
MVDQIYDRGYQAARSHLNGSLTAALSRAGKAAFNAFAVLNRIEYGAPWLAEQRPARNH